MNQRYLTYAIYIACAVGCVYHISHITEWYFKYPTQTMLDMRLPLEIQMPQLSACFRLDIMIKRDQLLISKGMNLPDGPSNWTAFYEQLQKLTIADILDYTPSPMEVLSQKGDACKVRYPDAFAVKYPYSNAHDCYAMFNITKYIQRQFMCYKFSVSNVPKDKNGRQTKIEVDEYSLSPNLPGLIYSLHLNNAIYGDVSLLSTFIHGENSSKLFDSIFAPSIEYKRNQRVHNTYANIDVSYRSVRIYRLEPPYDSMCRNYSPYGSRLEMTLDKVREEAVRTLDLVPAMDQVEQRYNSSLMTSMHVRNTTIAHALSELLHTYRVKSPECYIRYYLTGMRISGGSSVKINVNWPQDVYLILRMKPEQSTLDFIIYLSSVIGLWFGLTILDCFITIRRIQGIFRKKRARNAASLAFDQRHKFLPVIPSGHTLRPEFVKNDTLRLEPLRFSSLDHTLKSLDTVLARFEARLMNNVRMLMLSNHKPYYGNRCH